MFSVCLAEGSQHRLHFPSAHVDCSCPERGVPVRHHVGAHNEIAFRKYGGDTTISQSGEGSHCVNATFGRHIHYNNLRTDIRRVRIHSSASPVITGKLC